MATNAKKTQCPVSRIQFMGKAPAMRFAVGSDTFDAPAREFSTGSFGYHHAGKVTVMVDGKPVVFQLNLMATAVGSKDTE